MLALHRSPSHAAATDDAWLLEAAGLTVGLVPGSEANRKLTVQEDFFALEQAMSHTLVPRMGTGFDVHAIRTGRPMILCGVTIPCEFGLDGHSDADVGIHALCDAIYGALAEGDIGRHFPPTDDNWKDADSARFLRHAAALIASRGGFLSNADVTLICERPKITPHAPAMRARLAELLQVPLDAVSVKATTTEKLGFPGRWRGDCRAGRGLHYGEKQACSFLKKRTKKRLRVCAEPIRKGRSQNNQKFFASFFQKRRPSLLLPPSILAA